MERLSKDNPALYESGKATLKLVLGTAMNAFLANNPGYADEVDFALDALVNMTPKEAAEQVAQQLPDEAARAEFAMEVAKEVQLSGSEAPASDPAADAWLTQFVLFL